MYFIIIIALLLIFLSGKPRLQSNMIENGLYMSRERTMMINGFFIWIVFISHHNQYLLEANNKLTIDTHTMRLLWRIGQLCVATFFFYSGYGIMASIKKGGALYVKKLILRRFPNLLLHMTLAVCLYWLLQTCYGKSYTLSTVLLSFTGWNSLGNSNWFIFVSLTSYLIIAATYYLTRKWGNVLFFAVSIILFTGFIGACIYCNKGSYWYNTCLCVPAGMIFCQYRLYLEKLVLRTRIPAWVHGGALVLTSALLYRSIHRFPYLNNITAIVFALGITLIFSCISTKRVPMALSWSGGAGLFYLYIFQRIPMIIGYNSEWHLYSAPLYQLFCFICTILLAIAASKAFSQVDRLIFKTK